MATYVALIQFTDQGIRNIKDTVKRGDSAIPEAEKMGIKIVEQFWTMGAYDAVVILDAPDDETISALMLENGSHGNVKSHTIGGFRSKETQNFVKLRTHLLRARFSCRDHVSSEEHTS